MKSNWTQTEEKFGLEKGALQAVIYYLNRSWSAIVVYGPQTVANVAGRQQEYQDSPPRVELHERKDLPEVPEEGYPHPATEYGLTKGTVLLVPGAPPGD